MDAIIYAADIGSVRSGNFGWARLDPTEGYARVEQDDDTELPHSDCECSSVIGATDPQ